MKPTQYTDDELRFVLRHYQPGAFTPHEARQRLAGHQSSPASPPRRRWLAVAASLLCLVALASVAVWQVAGGDSAATPAATTVAPQQPQAAAAAAPAPADFCFDDTPLPQVLHELGGYYGVELTASDTTPHLTGSFQADSLSATLRIISQVLGVTISMGDER